MTKPRTKLSEAPVVFAKRFTSTCIQQGEVNAWHAKFGECTGRVAELDTGTHEATFRHGQVLMFCAAGEKDAVVGRLGTFLKALKRATVGVP